MRGDSGLSDSKQLLAQKTYTEKHQDLFDEIKKIEDQKYKEVSKKTLLQKIKEWFRFLK
jgi:hypothetical protein